MVEEAVAPADLEFFTASNNGRGSEDAPIEPRAGIFLQLASVFVVTVAGLVV